MQIQPKPFLNGMKYRNKAIGVERRRNMSKVILENGTPFPKYVEYSDIDSAFFDWVDNGLEVTYNGKKLPTYKLFSNQKLSEYSQTWSNLDDTGNIIMNFKTITRENNPQHGENQGGNYNIPGNRFYPMFMVPVLQENGSEAYSVYSMRQPLSVNFIYTVSIICNKYELLNSFNELIQYNFSALEKYIFPNGHPMPMTLENVTDESEYNIDDRKYYAQSFQIKLMGYIIRKEDFKVSDIPSRFSVRLKDSDEKKKYNRKVSTDTWLGEATVMTSINEDENKSNVIDNELSKSDAYELGIDIDNSSCNLIESGEKTPKKYIKPSVEVEEEYEEVCPPNDNPYYNKHVKIYIDYPYCEDKTVIFIVDSIVEVNSIETENIKEFTIYINDKEVNLEDEIKFSPNDEIKITVKMEDEYKGGKIKIEGIDPTVKFDRRTRYVTEDDDGIDDKVSLEELYISSEKENEEK